MRNAESSRHIALDDTAIQKVAIGEHAQILSQIYQPENNISIWQRKVSHDLEASIQAHLLQGLTVNIKKTVTPDSVKADIFPSLEDWECRDELIADISILVAMFCCLFELRHVGLRLATLDRAMCPRFHVDNVPCRLVTTYSGVGTQWLAHHEVNRKRLGAGNQGLPDHQSGLYPDSDSIQQLRMGDVALLKGEMWLGNEDSGLVHRSPELTAIDKTRLFLSLDFN
ncbi:MULTISPECIES: DUF1826 domain-containing protein [Vibrio]|uniref:DUF1826 domain-containing protein n=1 Tax=Vibrio algicola TaxID=2662262 RepID=A0A5Q0TMS6_9VIBR|nr:MULTISPECIES: DUF1826 domain-containing protein [Vibrio]MBD1577823.1 DUF1826 domain-containing protein [Vibrio sp. S11_S32]